MLVVLDTNVVVSAALIVGSVPRRAFDKALDEGKILCPFRFSSNWRKFWAETG